MNWSASTIGEKTPPEELIPDIADQFNVYSGKGLKFNSVFQNIDPDGTVSLDQPL